MASRGVSFFASFPLHLYSPQIAAFLEVGNRWSRTHGLPPPPSLLPSSCVVAVTVRRPLPSPNFIRSAPRQRRRRRRPLTCMRRQAASTRRTADVCHVSYGNEIGQILLLGKHVMTRKSIWSQKAIFAFAYSAEKRTDGTSDRTPTLRDYNFRLFRRFYDAAKHYTLSCNLNLSAPDQGFATCFVFRTMALLFRSCI